MKTPRTVVPGCLVAFVVLLSGLEAAAEPGEAPDIRLFFRAASLDADEAEAALETLAEGWRDGYASLIVDIARFFPSFRRPMRSSSDDWLRGAPAGPGSNPAERGSSFDELRNAGRQSAVLRSPRARVRARLIRFLEDQTGERFGDDLGKWRRWMWNRPYEPHPDYALFKALLYGQIDERMANFFTAGGESSIRLDEVDWGGVRVNGIPPLVRPKHVGAADAEYLDGDDIVFGISVNGEARAYPKRILAWHELARDEVGGVDLAIVYCTLCGTVIPYGAEVGGGRHRTFGTSGLLYRSNKLLFDEEAMSLWSTLEGRPVIGELVGAGLELEIYPVVTTSWNEWLTMHPGSLVLSIDTGYDRDYSEGAAYREYFGTDRLMFDVPEIDDRLENKDEVLAILLRPKGSSRNEERKALALSVEFLENNPLHHLDHAGYNLVVVTSREGANRVYDAAQHRFLKQDGDGTLVDARGSRWHLSEDALVRADGSGEARPRVPARRAFWFGWYAQFPETELIR